MANLEDEFGDIIAKARIGLGYTAKQLADLSDLTVRDIEDIEAYKLIPDKDILIKLAEALSLSPGKLIDIADNAWIPAVDTPKEVKAVPVSMGNYQENCYIIGCCESNKAVTIDPGGAVDSIIEWLTQSNMALELVLITHAHGDHIGGLKQLLAHYPNARLANHQLERDSVLVNIRANWEPAKDSVKIPVGSLSITPLFTPGHTPGSVCYLIDGMCFVGDTLFSGSIGRPASSKVYQQMLLEIRKKVLSLPDDTILLPGHGPVTTVGEEKAHNPFF